MGSSTNGVTRGQLRPYIGSRGPPFIICGLFIFLLIIGYSYWNLSFRFNILHKDFINLEEKLRTSATRNEHLIKQNEAMNENLQKSDAELQKAKTLLAKKDDELLQLSNQLHVKEDEITRLTSQIEMLKPEADKYKQANDELKTEKDHLDAEIKQLKEKNSALEQIINNPKFGNKQPETDSKPVKPQQISKQPIDSSAKKVDQSMAINESKRKDEEQKSEPALDPNVDAPNVEQKAL